MGIRARHLWHQREVVGSLLRAVLPGRDLDVPTPIAPGPEATVTVPARPPELVRDFITAMGGRPAAYRGQLPPLLFPQWGVPLLASLMEDLPYNPLSIINVGCRLEQVAPLTAGRPLRLRARFDEIDENDRRVLIKQRLITGSELAPDALVAHVHTMVPLPRKPGSERGGRPAKERPHIPLEARELDSLRLSPRAGLDFALLTGDINPTHWLTPWARMMGFKRPILHGFATAARAFESLVGSVALGRPARIATFEARFTRPLPLPNRMSVFIDGKGGVYVGHAPGGPSYLDGAYTLAKERDDG